MSESVHAVLLDAYDGADAVRVGTVAVPEPGLGEVLVRVRAAAIGPWDVFTTEGAFASLLGDAAHARFPMVLGWDLVGEIETAGAQAALSAGMRVAAMTRQPIIGVGAQTELVRLPAEACVPVPDDVPDAAAAALPCCGVTAWQAVEALHARPDDAVLVIGATGQLGGFVTQLAAHRGLQIIASVAAEDADAARALGAIAVVDRDDDVTAQVRAVHPEGVAAVFDPVGGAATAPAIAAVQDNGRHVRAVTWADPAAERGIETVTLFVQDDPTALGAVIELMAAGRLRGRPTEDVPLVKAQQAYASVQAGAATRRLVLCP